jgi:hypothetical protein
MVSLLSSFLILVPWCGSKAARYPTSCGGSASSLMLTDAGAAHLCSKAEHFPTSCAVKFESSARLCPCGERLPQWLTAEYVVSTLSREGGWGSVSPSLTGAALAGRARG